MWRKVSHSFRRKSAPNHSYPDRAPTPEARKLASLLQKWGWNVQLEKWDGYKHIDIAITESKINIEVDGGQHNHNMDQALKDLERTYYSFKKGYVTLRIPNVLVRDEYALQTTAKFIDKFLRASSDQLS